MSSGILSNLNHGGPRWTSFHHGYWLNADPSVGLVDLPSKFGTGTIDDQRTWFLMSHKNIYAISHFCLTNPYPLNQDKTCKPVPLSARPVACRPSA